MSRNRSRRSLKHCASYSQGRQDSITRGRGRPSSLIRGVCSATAATTGCRKCASELFDSGKAERLLGRFSRPSPRFSPHQLPRLRMIRPPRPVVPHLPSLASPPRIRNRPEPGRSAPTQPGATAPRVAPLPVPGQSSGGKAQPPADELQSMRPGTNQNRQDEQNAPATGRSCGARRRGTPADRAAR